jgi:hypothetical protein
MCCLYNLILYVHVSYSPWRIYHPQKSNVAKHPKPSAASFSPTKPKSSHIPATTDYVHRVNVTKCHGGVVVVDIERRDGSSYKARLYKAVNAKLPGTEKLNVIRVADHKAYRTENSKIKIVGGYAKDQVFVSWLGPDESVGTLMNNYAEEY